MANRVVIMLEQPEYSVLLKMVISSELRNWQNQIRWLLHCELERLELLSPVSNELKMEV